MGALDAISTQAREVLLEALMSVAWADRTLADEERKAAQAAAMGLGLVLPGDRDLTSPDRKPIPPERLDVTGLNSRDRELIFLCAAWMAFADEVEDPAETQVLERLAARFELSEARTHGLKERAEELRHRQTPDASWWRAFNALVVEAARALTEEAQAKG
ncbi:MAG: TerB family tellurite resistance protein [Myxococcales bacterium]|nr:TerB family tellurite resistance protein [Myxococcales bacterium]